MKDEEQKRMTVMALVLASAMFAGCGSSAETENTMETKEEPVVTEVTEERSTVSETEEDVDARMARFIEVVKGYGAETLHVQFQDSSMPQPEGYFQPRYWEFESTEAAASAFPEIPESYSWVHGCEVVEVADTRHL